jgi:Baculovirus 11 kDa family.
MRGMQNVNLSDFVVVFAAIIIIVIIIIIIIIIVNVLSLAQFSKKRIDDSLSNNRPFSILSTFSKTLEFVNRYIFYTV